jgi:hypothetical protein
LLAFAKAQAAFQQGKRMKTSPLRKNNPRYTRDSCRGA